MRPCDRCGKPVDNIETHCEKCHKYLQDHARDVPAEGAKENLPGPRDWSMDFMVWVACGSATVGGALIGWVKYGADGSLAGAIAGLFLAALLTRMLVV